jgi:hypothetical protein
MYSEKVVSYLPVFCFPSKAYHFLRLSKINFELTSLNSDVDWFEENFLVETGHGQILVDKTRF